MAVDRALSEGRQKVNPAAEIRHLHPGVANLKSSMSVTAGCSRKSVLPGPLPGQIGSALQRSTGVENFHHIDFIFDSLHYISLQSIRAEFIERMLGANQSALLPDTLNSFFNGDIPGNIPMISPLVVRISSATITLKGAIFCNKSAPSTSLWSAIATQLMFFF
jgi:hypothetical protein